MDDEKIIPVGNHGKFEFEELAEINEADYELQADLDRPYPPRKAGSSILNWLTPCDRTRFRIELARRRYCEL